MSRKRNYQGQRRHRMPKDTRRGVDGFSIMTGKRAAYWAAREKIENELDGLPFSRWLVDMVIQYAESGTFGGAEIATEDAHEVNLGSLFGSDIDDDDF